MTHLSYEKLPLTSTLNTDAKYSARFSDVATSFLFFLHLDHLLLSRTEGEKMFEKLLGQYKNGEITHDYHHEQNILDFVERNLIHLSDIEG